MMTPSNEGYQLALRPMEERERSYVIASWLQSYWAVARKREFRVRSEADFMRTYDRRVKASLDGGTRVLVAVDPNYPLVVAGWLAHKGVTLHYVYVRAPLRRQGVARALIREAGDLRAHSHATPDLARLHAAGVLYTVHRPLHFAPDTAQPRAAEHRA